MSKAVDFSRGRKGAVLSTRGKTRITIYLDDAIIERFKAMSEQTGKGYQTLINEALAAHDSEESAALTAAQGPQDRSGRTESEALKVGVCARDPRGGR